MANDAGTILKAIKDDGIEWVDLRFTDPKGKWQHLTMCAGVIGEDELTDGLMFDGSSIEGWKAINESDMILKPDLDAWYIDPFSATPMGILFCDIVDPGTGELYARDPRSTAKRAEAYLKATGVGDTIYVGPEAEFFMFDDVRFEDGYAASGFSLDDIELPTNTATKYENGNLAHRPRAKGGYFPVAPVDSASRHPRRDGLDHDRNGPADGQASSRGRRRPARARPHLRHAGPDRRPDADLQICRPHGRRTPTARPRPSCPSRSRPTTAPACTPTCRSGKRGKPLFAGNGYAGLSEMCLYFIGGVIKHAKALNAFTNPTTNSYKRLVPGFEAPVLLAYSSRNRSASCRIPYGTGEKAKRVEFRFPDALANPYLAYSALLMAGLDGIQNRIHPGDPIDKNLYDLPPQELVDVPTVCGSLREALIALHDDRAFLTKGDVFSDDQIDAYMELKWEEQLRWETTPSPVEYDMYYSS